MPKYKATYKVKVVTSKAGEPTAYRLVDGEKKIRAKSFSEARDKVRKSSGYDVIDIRVTEVKKSWIRRVLKF